VAEHGARKASVPRMIVRMMRGRFICAVILDLILNIVPLLRSVSLAVWHHVVLLDRIYIKI